MKAEGYLTQGQRRCSVTTETEVRMMRTQVKGHRIHQKLQILRARLPLELLEGTIDSNQISLLRECPKPLGLRHVVMAAKETKT